MKILLDTCALIWWTLDPENLSKSTIKKIEKADVFVSSISIWEVGLKINNHKLNIGMSIDKYLHGLHQLQNFTIIPIDENIWIQSLSLDWSHRDPADRVIVATAKLNNCVIVTSDLEIKSFYKKCIE